MGILIDDDIAHIACVMRPSLCEFQGDPILSAEYWRGRLHRLLDSYHLTKVQLCSIDSLLLQLDRFDAEQSARQHSPARTPSGSMRKTVTNRCRPDRGRDTARTDRHGKPAAPSPASPSEPVTRPDTSAPNGQTVKGANAMVQRSRVAAVNTQAPQRRSRTRTRAS